MDGAASESPLSAVHLTRSPTDENSSIDGQDDEENIPDMSLLSITEGENPRGIPIVKFIDDVGAFTASFTPPASAELLIGAYSELHSKFKTYETSLSQRYQNFQLKIPEIEKSLRLIKELKKKKEAGESVITRYSLADDVYAKAEIDFGADNSDVGVNLWLGANVMLEYSYEDAIEFLSNNEEFAKREYEEVKNDLGFVRDQIVTSEVSMSRIFNWDVRRKRNAEINAAKTGVAGTSAEAAVVKAKP